MEEIIEKKETIREKWQEFKEWQKEPFRVAPMSDETHICTTCETEYKGNFCPRCGQSAKVESKMTLWKNCLLFLDVWGIGNRGMFRTLRDLILRPGYLIADYIRGRRSAYFPPFKLLFLLTTLSLLVAHGWNLRGENYDFLDSKIEQSKIEEIADGSEGIQWFFNSANLLGDFIKNYPALWQITWMVFASFFIFMLFRKTKTIGKLDFHEFFIAMLYMTNMVTLYMIAFRFFGAPRSFVILMSVFLYLIPLKQLSGYSTLSTLGKYTISIIFALTSLLLILLFYIIILTLIFEDY